MRRKTGRKSLNFEENSEGIMFIEDDRIDEGLTWISDELDLEHMSHCYSFLYEIEKNLIKAYNDELELVIMF